MEGRLTERSDAEVMSRSLVDPAAFEAIFDRHAAVLFRFLVRRVGPDAADGLLGEVFLIAFERRATFDTATFDRARLSALPWLYGIAHHVLAKHRRSEGRRLKATTRAAARPPTPDDSFDRLSSALDARGLWPVVARAIAGLPEGERDALLLFAWEELSYEDISVALGVPVGTVRSRLNRARGRLRAVAASHTQERQEESS
jgi:RNA polymerase sigma factor (sigma-70 family)